MENNHEPDDDARQVACTESEQQERVGQFVAVGVLAAVAVVLMLLMATGVIDFPLV